MVSLSSSARTVLERRYLARDLAGNVTESPEEMFRRVAHCVAAVDVYYESSVDVCEREETYYSMMASLEFLPNSPTLMNAGRGSGQLSACFVLPVNDSIEGIFYALGAMARIHQTGGGTGFSFTRLRPKNDAVGSAGGVASGPVSFMGIFDHATEVVKQGGRRRGANMGILNIDHPDIMEFIGAKAEREAFRNFNLSVAVTDSFMEALKAGGTCRLVNPRDGSIAGEVPAEGLWRRIVDMAWLTGDPGIIYTDRINQCNPTPGLGRIEATNPCGEQPLLPYESCNLGSINLKLLVKDGTVDWERLGALVPEVVRFLDNVIDANQYPLPEIDTITKQNRKIGLGVMGFAEMLILLGVPYASPDAIAIAERLMEFIHQRAIEASAMLAKSRGNFPGFKGSLWERRGYAAMRNATVTTIAPTGSISIIAGTSSGIEPLFAIAFTRDVLDGLALNEVNDLFMAEAARSGILNEELEERIIRYGTVSALPEVPLPIKELFRTALEIPPEDHLRVQAAFQKHTDNGVSKTVNLPAEATREDVDKIYRLAFELGCKGVTVFRQSGEGRQVVYPGILAEGQCRVCKLSGEE